MSIEIDMQWRSGFVTYLGTREELIAAGVAVDAMFPEAPKTRRYWKGLHNPPVADYFKTTKVGAQWRVSRELGWEDQNYIRTRHAEREAEREALVAGWRRERETREAQEAHACAAAKVERTVAQLPNSAVDFRDAAHRMVCALLATLVEGGIAPSGGYYFDDATAEEVRDLAVEISAAIANAEVRYSEAKRLMAEAELRAPLLAEAESE